MVECHSCHRMCSCKTSKSVTHFKIQYADCNIQEVSLSLLKNTYGLTITMGLWPKGTAHAHVKTGCRFESMITMITRVPSGFSGCILRMARYKNWAEKEVR